MDKIQLKARLLATLDGMIEAAITAATEAQQTASHADNQPENQYDTLSLEAAYLAYGQSERVQQLQEQRHLISQWQPISETLPDGVEQSVEDHGRASEEYSDAIRLGSVVELESGEKHAGAFWLWLAPLGGFSIDSDQGKIQLISCETPLAKALLGHSVDDEVIVKQGIQQVCYQILDVY